MPQPKLHSSPEGSPKRYIVEKNPKPSFYRFSRNVLPDFQALSHRKSPLFSPACPEHPQHPARTSPLGVPPQLSRQRGHSQGTSARGGAHDKPQQTPPAPNCASSRNPQRQGSERRRPGGFSPALRRGRSAAGPLTAARGGDLPSGRGSRRREPRGGHAPSRLTQH